MASDASPFRSWNGVEQWQFVDGVKLHAIGGEQVLLCRVTYAPGKFVPRHTHSEAEQAMVVLRNASCALLPRNIRVFSKQRVIVLKT